LTIGLNIRSLTSSSHIELSRDLTVGYARVPAPCRSTIYVSDTVSLLQTHLYSARLFPIQSRSVFASQQSLGLVDTTMMFRRWKKKKSLQRRAWCMGSFLCREVDEEIYVNVRHRLQRCGGVETLVKLSASGWSSGGGRNVPSQFYGLDMINAVEPDTVFANILLCVFRRVDAAADFPFETVAYKFDNVKGPREFQQLFATLCPPQRNGGPGLVKKPSVLPGRATTGRTTGKQPVSMPGRPTHGVVGGAVAPDRWAAKDRATPRLFASRSLDDLLEDNASSSYVHGRRLSLDDDDNLDDELPDHSSSSSTSPSLAPVILPADTVLDGVNGALDGAWWSEDDEAAAAVRTKDVGVGVTFPDATDRLRQQRRAGLEFWVDGDDVACQAYVLAATMKTTPVKCYLDDDDYVDDDADDEFKWVFSSDEEDDQPVFDASYNVQVAYSNRAP